MTPSHTQIVRTPRDEYIEHLRARSYYLTIAEAKAEYRYSHSGIYRGIAAGEIEAVKRGRSTLLVRASIERTLAAQPRLGQRAAA